MKNLEIANSQIIIEKEYLNRQNQELKDEIKQLQNKIEY
jgi:hypothetical protein